jgi:hypothetical protein
VWRSLLKLAQKYVHSDMLNGGVVTVIISEGRGKDVWLWVKLLK